MNGPPPISLDDLDADMLRQLIRERMFFSPNPTDLWGARWHVLSQRALALGEAEAKAGHAWSDSLGAINAATGPAKIRAIDISQRHKKAFDAARKRCARADAEAKRAWSALEKCWGRNKPL